MAIKKATKKPTPKKENTSFWGKLKNFIFKSALFLGISVFVVIVFRFAPIFFTPLMAIRAIEHNQSGKDMICSHNWIPLEDISLNMPKAVVASEKVI